MFCGTHRPDLSVSSPRAIEAPKGDDTMARARLRSPGLIVVASALAIALASGSAHAGPVKPKPVVGEIVLDGRTSPVTGFAWEVTADSSWTKGGGASVGKPNPGKLRVQKPIDGSSISELVNIVAGQSFQTAVLRLTSGKGNSASTTVYEMTNLFVTGVSHSAADGLTTGELGSSGR
jgi:hypothetical protein